MTKQKKVALLEPGNFFVFRTPLLPRTHLQLVTRKELPQVMEFSQQLAKQYEHPDLRQALYLASPDLFQRLGRWHPLLAQENLPKKARQERDELSRKFLMFLARAAYRCTPFGTFAAVSAGSFKLQRESQLDLSQLPAMRTSSRLDMVYLLRLRAVLEAQEQIKTQLKFFPNNTLYQNGKDMLCSYFDGKLLQHVASSRGFNETAWELLEACRAAEGMTINEMMGFITEDELAQEDCLEFIEYLIEHQLLISALYPRLNGEEYLTQIHQVISALPTPPHHLGFIEAIQTKLRVIDATINTTESLCQYQELVHFLTESKEATQLGLKTEQVKTRELIQVDAFKDLESSVLSKAVARDIVRKIEALYQLPTPKAPPHRDLARFKTAFFKRYEHEPVPLLQAMDEVVGVGYPYGQKVASLTPNLQVLGVVVNEAIPGNHPPFSSQVSPLANEVDEWLAQAYQEALQSGSPQIDLTQANVQKFQNNSQKNKLARKSDMLPPAMLAMGKLLFQHPKDLIHDPKNGRPRNFYFQLYHASSPGVGNLLGRFCHGDATLKAKLRETIAEVEPDQENIIYAEIDHLPGQRVGNVILRPQLRAYTIVLGGPYTNDPHDIPVADLWLKVDQGQQLVLFSPKLDKIILPRMSNAHNYAHNAHPLYKFLCDLQHQTTYQRMPAFFGHPRWQATPYTPRLVYENIILSPQTWKVHRSTLEKLGIKKNEHLAQAEGKGKIQALQSQLTLPNTVLLVEGDNKLYIDLKNPLSVGILLQKAFKNPQIILEEVIEQAFPSQAYSNEMIFPIVNTIGISEAKKAISSTLSELPQMNSSVQKNFAFGSEWVYYKIYLGTLGADRLIVQHLYPLSKQLKNQGFIDHWFFIRYTDGDFGPHLRWRLKLTDHEYFGQVVQLFSQQLLALQNQGLIIHSQPDTYQRELSRYLPHNMVTSEALFEIDSWFVSHALYLLATDEVSTTSPENLPLTLALQRIYALLQGLELSEHTIQQIIQRGQRSFSKEFGFDKHPQSKTLKNSLTKDYLEQCIKPALSQASLPGVNPEFYNLLNQLKAAEAPILKQVKTNLIQHGGNEAQIISLTGSYIHMFVNRFFATTQRFQEMWLYNALGVGLKGDG